MKEKYENIFFRSREDILNNNVEIDKHLFDIENDGRMGLTVIAKIDAGCVEGFSQIISEFKKIEPDQYFYPLSDISQLSPGDLVRIPDGLGKIDKIINSKIDDIEICKGCAFKDTYEWIAAN